MAANTKYLKISDIPVPMSFLVENELLGMLVCNPEYIPIARKKLTRESFADSENGRIWDTLCAMDDSREDISEGKIFSRCNGPHFQDNILKHCTGTEPISAVYDKMNAVWQVDMRRRAYFTATKMLQAASGGTAADALEIATIWAEQMQGEMEDTDTRKVCDAVNELATIIERRQKESAEGRPLRIPTSFRQLDFLTYGGFANGNLIILAARPSVGKTAIALQMARMAAEKGLSAMVFSLEMTNAELVQRMIRSVSNINGYQMAQGNIDWSAFEKATGKFADLPLWLNDKASYFDDICGKITAACRQGKCNIAFIDYLGLISFKNEGASIYQQISAATKRIKRLAKDCNIPIVLLSQLNRDMSKEGRAPELHDLRDSGSIEQDADIVLMLDRELSDDPMISSQVRMWVRKNRQGRAGDCIRLQADDTFCNFNEIEQPQNI